MKEYAKLRILALLATLCLSACTIPVSSGGDTLEFSAPEPTQKLIAQTGGTPMPAPTEEVSKPPETIYAKIGAVGDIMIMQSQIDGAWNKELQAYDFTMSFRAMHPWFSNTDKLFANLETPLAGEDAGYSIAGSTRPTPRPDGSIPDFDFQTFNAPDELAISLVKSGFNAISTANNHCLDRGKEGMYRTAEVLREAGLVQAGTYLHEFDRNTARIIDANGIKLGFVAWAVSVNRNDSLLDEDEQTFAIGRTADEKGMLKDIQLAKEAGAELIVAYVHWDVEFESQPRSSTKNLASWLLKNGVDVILGSHPHVVQPVEYVIVERDEGEFTGLVAYSLGNFISNMSSYATDFGMYLELTIEKTPDGKVGLYEAGYLPLYCIKRKVDGRRLHEVLPALEDTGSIGYIEGASSDQLEAIKEAREYVISVAGDSIKVLG